MNDYHVVLGAITVAITIFGYALYLRSILRGQTKPHPFTWLLFLVLDSTVFLAQVLHGGGPGAWSMGVGTFFAGLVFLLALKQGEKRIVRIDWACLTIALLGVAAWGATNNALYAVVLASVSDAIAKIPTIRKSYLRPEEESLSIWSLDIVRFSLSVVALSSISWTTALFPAEIVFTNAILVLMILLRRRQLGS